MSDSATKTALEGKGVYTERKFIDAETARQWIRKNISNNRPVQQTRVKEFIRDMKTGRWKENGSTIVFSRDGELIDGQHRLQACMEGGVGFWTLIAYNVDKDAFMTIDRGQSRSTGQMLHLATGLTDYNAVSATLSYLYRFRDGIMMMTGRPTSTEAEEMLLMNPGISDSVAAARRVTARFKAGPVPIIALCHYLFTRQDATLAEAFFDALATGASLREVDPVYQLRARIISASASTAKRIHSYELFALIFKAWLAEREQRIMRQSLRWNQAEAFPNIGLIESIHKVRKLSHPEQSHIGRRKKKAVPEKLPEPPKQVDSTTKLDQLIHKHQGLDKR